MTVLLLLGAMLAVILDLRIVTYALGSAAFVALLLGTVFDLWEPPDK